MFSIYHFFAHLHRNRERLKSLAKLGDFPFDMELLSCSSTGRFPDMAVRINPSGDPSGGELIELKDSKSYMVSSFNSTIPTGRKAIAPLTGGATNRLREQMEAAGDDIHSLPIRDVYYLVRGRKDEHTKICLVHGSFFETVAVDELIRQAFSQVLEERLADQDEKIDDAVRQFILSIFSRQDSFNKVRHVENASVKLRFRIMTEVKKEGNILGARNYPKIKDDTLSLVIPHGSPDDFQLRKAHLQAALSHSELSMSSEFVIQHPFNGEFFVWSFAL